MRRRVVLDRPGRIQGGRAEDGRRRRVHHARDASSAGPGGLEDVGGAHHVDERATCGILPAQRDLPRGEMDDVLDGVLSHRPDDGVAVGDVAPHDGEAPGDVGPRDHPHSPGIVGDVIDDGTLAGGEEAAHDPRPDAAEAAGHERGHGLAP
jgi:hypothetical protein